MKSSLDGSRDCMRACFSGISLIFFPVYLLAALSLCCTWASSACGDWGQLTVAVCGLRWLLLLESIGSRRAGFSSRSCSTACGIFLDQGLNPCPLCWLCCAVLCCSVVSDSAAPWNVACQAPSSLAGGLLFTILPGEF